MNDAQRIIDDIIAHCHEIRRLSNTLEKRYGIHICSIEPLYSYFFSEGMRDSVKIQVYYGFRELIQKLNLSDHVIRDEKKLFHIMYGKTEICTVTNGTKRFRPALRRNNKWTRMEVHHETDA